MLFDLPRLQKDIIKAYLAGKPLIEHSPEHVRVPFRFRAEPSKTVTLGGADLDLSVISDYIRPDSGFRVRNTTTNVCTKECTWLNVWTIFFSLCLTQNTLRHLSVNSIRLTTINWLKWLRV